MALDIHDTSCEMQSNKKINYYKCDITSVDAVNATADAIRSDFGNPSILINNAGVAFRRQHPASHARPSSPQSSTSTPSPTTSP